MKDIVVNKCMNYISKNTKYNKTKLAEIKYGIEGIYLTITKLIIVLVISILLGIFKEVLIFILFYNFIRMPSFGLHATKSWICLLSSIIVFIGIPYLCTILNINIILKIIICAFCILLMYKNSPADTKKRPIINKNRRKKYKIISTLIAIFYSILCLYINNEFISNCVLFSMITQNIMISPMTYKIFKLPYNNYITFLKEHPEYQN